MKLSGSMVTILEHDNILAKYTVERVKRDISFPVTVDKRICAKLDQEVSHYQAHHSTRFFADIHDAAISGLFRYLLTKSGTAPDFVSPSEDGYEVAEHTSATWYATRADQRRSLTTIWPASWNNIEWLFRLVWSQGGNVLCLIMIHNKSSTAQFWQT